MDSYIFDTNLSYKSNTLASKIYIGDSVSIGVNSKIDDIENNIERQIKCQEKYISRHNWRSKAKHGRR